MNKNNHLVSDSLKEVTRKERKFLLLSSAVGYIVSTTGLIPTKISTLGIEISPNDQKSFLWAIALIITYFLVSFAIYGFSDAVTWFTKRNEIDKSDARDAILRGSGEPEDFDLEEHHLKIVKESDRLKNHSKVMSWIRILFDVSFPIIAAVISIICISSVELPK